MGEIRECYLCLNRLTERPSKIEETTGQDIVVIFRMSHFNLNVRLDGADQMMSHMTETSVSMFIDCIDQSHHANLEPMEV